MPEPRHPPRRHAAAALFLERANDPPAALTRVSHNPRICFKPPPSGRGLAAARPVVVPSDASIIEIEYGDFLMRCSKGPATVLRQTKAESCCARCHHIGRSNIASARSCQLENVRPTRRNPGPHRGRPMPAMRSVMLDAHMTRSELSNSCRDEWARITCGSRPMQRPAAQPYQTLATIYAVPPTVMRSMRSVG